MPGIRAPLKDRSARNSAYNPANNLTSRGAMESKEQELLTVIRDLRAKRNAKRKEERKEEARLEELKLRLRIKLNDQTERNGKPIARTA
jgi:hypothetical protein